MSDQLPPPLRIVNDCGLTCGWLVGSVPAHRLCATFIVKGTFDLVPGAEAVPSAEQEGLQGDLAEPEAAEAIRYGSDFAPIKPKADLLLTGTVFAPGGKPAISVQAGFHVGGYSKTLVVVGDRKVARTLLGSAAGQPAPYEQAALSWSRSYGGAGFAANPAGRGATDVAGPSGEKFRMQPNILRRSELGAMPSAALDPAGFGPIAPFWPQRMDKARRASYDGQWLKTTWPAPPRDFDWSYFNAAPEDQQLAEYLRGDERIRLENLRPGGGFLDSRLPGLRIRWFLDEVVDCRPRWREIPLVLDTLHADADRPRLILLWRGAGALQSNKMKEIRQHFIVREKLTDAPLPAERYRELLPERLKQIEEAAATPAATMPDIPPVVIPDIPFDWDAWEKGFEEDLQEAQKLIDADPAPAAVPRQEYSQVHEALGLSRPLPEPVPEVDPSALGKTIQSLFEKVRQADAERGAALGPPPSAAELDAQAALQAVVQEFEEPDEAEPEEEAQAEPTPWTRERCAEHAARGGDFSEQVLADLDLSELDFHGLRFLGAVLQGARLTGCNLEGADFSGATLAGADLSRTRLRGAVLAGADLAGANLAQTDLCEAKLQEADLSGSKLTGARLERADASAASFAGADLGGAILRGIHAPRSDFTGATLTGVDLSGAMLQGASAYQAIASGADFSRADLTNFRTGERADLSKARLAGITAPGSVWETASLEGADFSEAILPEANFADARLEGASFVAADLRKARFPDADLRKARLIRANLFRVLLEGASLEGADLRGANLYEAEFLNARTNSADFRLANLKGTKLA